MSKVISIDVTDWNEKTLQILKDETADFNSLESIMETVSFPYKLNTSELGKIMIIAYELGLVDDKLWAEHKEVFGLGGGTKARLLVTRAVQEKELHNGNTVKMRSYVGKGGRPELEEEQIPNVTQANDEENHMANVTHEKNENEYTIVKSNSNEGIERAKDYLLNIVPGYIYSRLVILADEEDITELVEQLKDKIDEMVDKLI